MLAHFFTSFLWRVHCLMVRLKIRLQITLESMPAFLIEASRNSGLQQGLNFASSTRRPNVIFDNRPRELFLVVVLHTMVRFCNFYIWIWFCIEENAAEIEF